MTPQKETVRTDRQGVPPAETLQVLMLGIGEEILAIETDAVREIIDPVPATPIAGARAFVPALANVRGNIVPLADLHDRFGLPKPAVTADTRIVVVEIEIDGDQVAVGLTADKVYEVTTLSTATIQQTPRLGPRWKPEFIRFVAKWNDEFVIVPDLEATLT
jgi:purine-binding chemotaxis protein CheW